ncbi:MAG: hypothetical protein KJ757_01245, partial [Planctomycetes bacterium]|nr:hypothetical protein [Planctomycetota bacterium]
VGRSYYAMFHAASALLSGKDIKRHSHQGLISAFGQFFVKPGNIEPKFHKQACLKGKKTSAKDDFCTMCGKNWCSLRINKELAKIHSKK